ncbi:Mitochondrial folate transporter/carrier [Hondaea fermentalgiana]|uniref:Mitochondrial folate transporter/carrier n=1 Tax=Hondaea fermentalgiana TaxID=2315210 RepID=A0A2R5G7J5_9STRA|nr:Mitochondrial folate transporter/carrier [Hondaea fermentalgiana]|eukprot:GBG26970.1 Mitochondrial folate transporter/carrier [Hondaea fermentalgiana]
MSKNDGGIAFASGLFAGFTTTVALHPLDLIKTRFQVDEGTIKHGSLLDRFRARLDGASRAVESTILTSRKIHREGGLRGLYRGLVPAVVGSSASWGIYFFLYEKLKSTASASLENGERLSAWQYLGTSAAAGAMTTLCTNPVWLVKTRLELQTPGNEPYRGFTHAFTTILREEGLAGLYRGIVPALILVSNGGFQFMVYEELKHSLGDRTLTAVDYMLLGALSKSVASTITYPYQVVKSRMQQHRSTYTSTLGTFSRIIESQGVFGLYRGMVPNLLRVMPSSAITFCTYELTKRAMQERSSSES